MLIIIRINMKRSIEKYTILSKQLLTLKMQNSLKFTFCQPGLGKFFPKNSIQKQVFKQNTKMLSKLYQTNVSSFSTSKQAILAQENQKNETFLDPKYSAFQISQKDFSEILKFITKQIIQNQTICSHIGISYDQFVQLVNTMVRNCCKSGLSYGIRYDGQIVAARMSAQHQNCVIDEPKSLKGKIVLAILTKLQEDYTPIDPKRALYIFVTATHKDHHKKGLYQKMVEQSEREWKRRGFNQHYASCTGSITTNMLKKLGYQQRNSIIYEDFKYEEMKPFAGIKSYNSINLMVRKWK